MSEKVEAENAQKDRAAEAEIEPAPQQLRLFAERRAEGGQSEKRIQEQQIRTAQDPRAMGVDDLRADTHRHNEAMKKLLRRSGFQFRGNVLYNVGEGHDPRRQAFEKVLK